MKDQTSAQSLLECERLDHEILGEELEVGLSLARRLERGVLEYDAKCGVVRKAEHSGVSADELSSAYGSTIGTTSGELSNILPPEERLGRLPFTKSVIDTLENNFADFADEPKVSSERQRIASDQTWTELESMSLNRINGRRSRPPSAFSSGHNSRASFADHRPTLQKKSGQYSTLSTNAPTRGWGHAVAPAHLK
ncbi:hypothetical protein BC826DRAFT_470951 [Russula brevipes]|nr:hypothetical protein BC826DRAFT_470951 [Russula brevipes]